MSSKREELKDKALLAVWICNYSGMRSSPLGIEDLIGYEDPDTGQVFTNKLEYHKHCREKVLAKKEG